MLNMVEVFLLQLQNTEKHKIFDITKWYYIQLWIIINNFYFCIIIQNNMNSSAIFVIKKQNNEKHNICDINTFYCMQL